MTHQEANQKQAVERYLLGELSDAERGEFEEHFFSCLECTAEVRAGAIFAANARAVFAEEARRAASAGKTTERSWLGWLRPAFAATAAASVALLAVAGYLLLAVIPGLKRELARTTEPQAYPAFFLRPVARGDDQILEVSRTARFVGLSLDVPPERAFPSYECEIIGPSGQAGMSVQAPAPRSPGSPLNVLLPASALRPGRCTLLLRGRMDGSSGSEVNRFNFIIQFK